MNPWKNRLIHLASYYWITGFSLIFLLFVGLPFFAPVLMELGMKTPARIIYAIYSFLCHQLPQRSFFLFGPQFTYSLKEIKVAWIDTNDPIILRKFIGSPEMGWKVAWSDRMVSLYSGILFFSWIWILIKARIKPLAWQSAILFMLPMAIDGFTHMVSDFSGLGNGFRDSNIWLVKITNSVFPPGFYSGDNWGSFNSIMRLATGFLFGTGIVWFVFPSLSVLFKAWEIHNHSRIRE